MEQQKQLISQYVQSGHFSEALRVAQGLCRKCPQDGQAWYLLGTLSAQTGDFVNAETALQKAAGLCSQMAVVHFNLAVARERLGKLGEAAGSLRRAISLNPGFAEAYCELANVLSRQNVLDEARSFYQQALKLKTVYPEARCNYAALLARCSDPVGAAREYRQALKSRPGMTEAVIGLAAALDIQGQQEEAERVLQTALQHFPNDRHLLCAVGNHYATSGQHEKALQQFACVQRNNPADVEACTNLANALVELGRVDDALAEYRRVLGQRPDYVPALVNLGKTCRESGKPDEAVKKLQRAIEVRPEVAEAHYNLANAYSDLFQYADAELCYQNALKHNPGLAEAALNLGTLLLLQGRVEEATDYYRRACDSRPDYPQAYSNYLMSLNYLPDCRPELIYREHCDWGDRQLECVPDSSGSTRTARTEGVLCVGLVSRDFRNHSVAFFIEALLRHRNSEKIRIICYSNVCRPDERTDRLKALADIWRDITVLSDEQAASNVIQDKVDILIDLAGYTEGNRLGVFARKPAPVQVSYLGYPNTTGLATVDYRISDALADPVGSECFCREKIVRLPDVFICYTAPETSPPAEIEDTGDERSITFASFNNLAKVNSQLIDIWAQLLQTVEGSRLMLKGMAFADASVAKRFFAEFERRGVAEDRLELRAWTRGISDHLQLYHHVDVALDTFPYNGTTTTCEALWMGVPVVTLAGDTHASRVGSSILHAIGCSDWVTKTPDEYVNKAKALVCARSAGNGARSTLRQQVQNSPLMDARHFTRNMEALLIGLCQ